MQSKGSLHVPHVVPACLLAREVQVLLAQLHADDAAIREAARDRHRGDSGAAGEVENPAGPRRDLADDAPLPKPVDSEGCDVDHDVIRIARAAEKPLDKRKTRIIFRHC